jgi:hypothetical protein
MSISFQIDTRLGVVFTDCCETIADSEVLNHLAMIQQARTYRPSFIHLVDLTGVRVWSVSADLIRSIARKKLFASGSHCAVVAPQDHIYGMARMFEMQYDGSVQVFRDLAAAKGWLRIDAPAEHALKRGNSKRRSQLAS